MRLKELVANAECSDRDLLKILWGRLCLLEKSVSSSVHMNRAVPASYVLKKIEDMKQECARVAGK